MRNAAAIVGVGATPYYRRGMSHPTTMNELIIQAVSAAADDAGLSVTDIDGFAYYVGGFDTALLAQTLGIPEIRFSAALTSGGGGSAGSIGLAAAAISSGQAEVVVSVMAIKQDRRYGTSFAPSDEDLAGGGYQPKPNAETDFIIPAGMVSPVQNFAMITQRHMHEYGTTREHVAEVVLSTRANAVRRPSALMRTELTLDDYFAARMISEPLCLFDCCLESEGAVAVITTSAERAQHLRQKPVRIAASAQGGAGRWGQAILWFGMPSEYFASSGHRPVAKRLYAMAGLGPSDIDVALLYDHFAPMVLLQLEDYGIAPIGESGPFVSEGNIRWPYGRIPVNTHGGNLSEAYIIGMTHVMEGVHQIRGTAVNQVAGAEVALVTGGPASLPVSSLLLTA